MRTYNVDEYPLLSNEELARKRPVHLAAGMLVLAEYSSVESHVSVLLTSMAHADPKPLVALYGVLRQGHVQAKALRAVANAVLSPNDMQSLNRLMTLIKKASDARDQLAHRLWFYDDKLPDDIVLVDPSLMWTMTHQVRVAGGPGPVPRDQALEMQAALRNACHIWSRMDLELARVTAAQAAIGLQSLNLMLKASDAAARANEQQKLEALLSLAEV
jgi:hypothetical protein